MQRHNMMGLILTIVTLCVPCRSYASATAQDKVPPVFQIEVFPKSHASATIDEVEFEVKKGVRYFKIDINSIFPWICEAEIQNVYADDEALSNSGNTWFVHRNFNIYNVAIRYYVPSNKGYCSFIVKGYQQ